MSTPRRYSPNIIVTGTPGCGKSSHSQCLVDQLNQTLFQEGTVYHFKHFNISEVAKERDCIESYDKKRDTHVVNEDKLLDSLEPDLRSGGVIVDWHCCDIFPERLIDLVIVLKTDNSKLYDRLQKRNYKESKIQENLDCEIMQVILGEARDAYIPEIVIELESDTAEQMDENVDRITSWVKNWIQDHPKGVTNELEDGAHSDKSEEEGGEGEGGEGEGGEGEGGEGEGEGDYSDESFDSDDADEDESESEEDEENNSDAAFNTDNEDPANVEDGLNDDEKTTLEQEEQDQEQAREEGEEATNEEMEHTEDIAQ